MRVDVGQVVFAKPGDVVWVRARLPKSMANYVRTNQIVHDMRVSVWSRTPGFEWSPHVQLAALGITRNGMPEMVTPMRLLLNAAMPARELSFIADDALEFRVRQDIDVIGDPLATVKTQSMGLRMFRFKKWLRRKLEFLPILRARGLVQQ